MLHYEVYSKWMNGLCLLKYVVFIRYISPRHCGDTGLVEDIHVISWLRSLRNVVDLQNKDQDIRIVTWFEVNEQDKSRMEIKFWKLGM